MKPSLPIKSYAEISNFQAKQKFEMIKGEKFQTKITITQCDNCQKNNKFQALSTSAMKKRKISKLQICKILPDLQ
jgi:hypothetical protein